MSVNIKCQSTSSCVQHLSLGLIIIRNLELKPQWKDFNSDSFLLVKGLQVFVLSWFSSPLENQYQHLMLAFKNFLIKSYQVILGFFFLQKYYAQFLVIFTTTSEEQGMFCLYNLKNIEFGYRKLPRLESSSLKRIEEQEPRQIQLYGAERVRVR